MYISKYNNNYNTMMTQYSFLLRRYKNKPILWYPRVFVKRKKTIHNKHDCADNIIPIVIQ